MFIFLLVGLIVFVILIILSYPTNEVISFLLSYSFFSSLLIILSLSKSISSIVCVCLFMYFIFPIICNYIGKTWESIINFYGFYREANFRDKILTVSVGFLFLLLLLFSIQISHISPPALSPSTQSEISKIFENLPQGLFVYSCSKEMTVGIRETCTARVANDKYLSNFKDAIIKGLNTQYLEKIKLQYTTSIMTVKLTGQNFYIKLKGNEEQLIEDREHPGFVN